ncbi:unnamed protein product, partial [Nesidiocoris tenuis]
KSILTKGLANLQHHSARGNAPEFITGYHQLVRMWFSSSISAIRIKKTDCHMATAMFLMVKDFKGSLVQSHSVQAVICDCCVTCSPGRAQIPTYLERQCYDLSCHPSILHFSPRKPAPIPPSIPYNPHPTPSLRSSLPVFRTLAQANDGAIEEYS